ncbi:MAG: aminoglycoside phosphotransferase family protein [Acidimicrobiales bacterium]
MPAADVRIDIRLVQDLLAEQHPDLVGLAISPLATGWDNVSFRLGDRFVVRLPRRAESAAVIAHEQRWLPMLAPRLPLPVPVPIRIGTSIDRYPYRWSVCPWYPGESAADTPPTDLRDAAAKLGAFVGALATIEVPLDAPLNPWRGIPLMERDARTRDAIAVIPERWREAALAAWEGAVALPEHAGPPRWLHGDLHPANTVVDGGRLIAVIDFTDLCVGDPATDLMSAWMLLPTEHHATFREAAGADDESLWRRGRGWALTHAVATLSNSADNPLMRQMSEATLTRVLPEA